MNKIFEKDVYAFRVFVVTVLSVLVFLAGMGSAKLEKIEDSIKCEPTPNAPGEGE
jgi:hypothetical protein